MQLLRFWRLLTQRRVLWESVHFAVLHRLSLLLPLQVSYTVSHALYDTSEIDVKTRTVRLTDSDSLTKQNLPLRQAKIPGYTVPLAQALCCQ